MSEDFYIKIDIDSDTKIGIFESSHFGAFREHFSCENKSRNMIPAHKRKFVPKRNYMISPSGEFAIGLLNEIYSYAKQIRPDLKKSEFEVTSEARYFYEPKFLIPDDYELYQFDGFEYRDIQEKAIKRTLERGRGVVNVGTAGGKGLTMAGTIRTLQKYNPSLNYLLIVLPHLVEKTTKEFIDDYGFTENEICSWCSGSKPNFNLPIVVASTRIINEKNIQNVINRNVVLIDECHCVKESSGITDIVKKMSTNNIIGYTGTVPREDDMVNRWSVLGVIGKVICKFTSTDLRNKGYKAEAKIVAVKLKGCKYKPKLTEKINGVKVQRDRNIVYREEEEYLLTSEGRNNYIKKFILKFCNGNTMIPIDWNYHEELLRDLFSDLDRNVYFVNGDTPKGDKVKIYEQLENEKDAILVVKTGVMREGVNLKEMQFMVGFFAKKAYIKTLQLLGRIERKSKNNELPVMFDFYDETRKSKEHFKVREQIYQEDNLPIIYKEIKLDY